MAKLTYDNKIQMNENANIPAVNKGRAVDWNEIKTVVNENDDNVGDLSDLDTTDKTSIVNAINEVKAKITDLWTGTIATTETEVTLIDNWTNYDMVVILGTSYNWTTSLVCFPNISQSRYSDVGRLENAYVIQADFREMDNNKIKIMAGSTQTSAHIIGVKF